MNEFVSYTVLKDSISHACVKGTNQFASVKGGAPTWIHCGNGYIRLERVIAKASKINNGGRTGR